MSISYTDFKALDNSKLICVDALGRICDTEEDFRRARRDRTLPITAYQRSVQTVDHSFGGKDGHPLIMLEQDSADGIE